MNAQVPAYESMLDAYHRAFRSELLAMVATLPLKPGDLTLEVACGDGAYTPMLAERVGPNGHVVAVDNNPGYLQIAGQEASRRGQADRIEFVVGSIEGLPFPDGHFDFCWCAHSLYSLPEPVEALKEMARVTRPGGMIGVLESDTLHHVLLPWPIEIELSVKAAELRVLVAETDKPRKFYVGRDLRSAYRRAGLIDIQTKTFAHDRAFPIGEAERTFLTEYLDRLSKRVTEYLGSEILEKYQALTDPDSDEFLLNNPDLSATCIDQLAWGRKPD